MAAGNADHTGENLLKNCYMGRMSENNTNRGVCTGYINAVIDIAMATGEICEINFDPKSKRRTALTRRTITPTGTPPC
jgi:hypothetical protein